MAFSPNLDNSNLKAALTESTPEQTSAQEKRLLELYNLALEQNDYLAALDLAEKLDSQVLLKDVIEQGLEWAEHCQPNEWGVRKGITLILHHVKEKLESQKTT